MAFWDTVMDSPGAVPHGRRLVPAMVDAIARDDPERICFSFPRTTNLEEGFQDLSFRTFANAINKTAHFIQREIGRSSMFETVLYMGYPDVRHFIVLIALMKTGHKALFSSHRNSVSGHANLIKRTDCSILLHAAGFPVGGLVEKCRMETLCMPELAYLLDDSTPCEQYPYNQSFEEAKNHPCLVVHTAGTTGLPMPVVWTHYSLTTPDSHQRVSPLDGRPAIWGGVLDEAKRSFSAMPIFHGAVVASGIQMAIYNNITIVLGPSGLTTADGFNEVLQYGNIDAANCVPATLEEIATRPDVLAKLNKLKHITYVAGPIPKEAGDIVARRVPLYSIMSSTETGILVQHATDREDWQYICLHPTHNGIEMRPLAGLYELVFVKDSAVEPFQGVFKALPRLTEYSTSDLYSKHPTKEYHWRHEGRKEDMILLDNGLVFNPMMHEYLITSHPVVQNCILVGTGRKTPAAIIELNTGYYTEDEKQKEEILKSIWANVEQANTIAGTNGELKKEHITFAKKEKPFKIAGKGTVERKATVKNYAREIEELYRKLS